MPSDMQAARTLGDVLAIQALRRGDATALIFEGRRTSFAELDRRADKVAEGLRRLGVGAEDRVAFLSRNTDAFFELWFGAARAGAVLTPVNWRLSAGEVSHILQDAGARAVFVSGEFRHLLPGDLGATAGERVIFLEPDGGSRDYAAWRDAQLPAPRDYPVDPEGIALQLYTSGTTGLPKGAMLSHRSLVASRAAQQQHGADWLRWTPDDVSLVAMPLFHIGGAGVGLTGLYYGSTGIIAREFEPGAVLDHVHSDGVTKLFVVPSAMQMLARHPAARDTNFSRLKHISYGASPIPLDLLRECLTVFGCGFIQMYGLTETTGTIVALPPEDHDPDRPERMRAAGKPLAGVELRVVDGAGRPRPAGEVGEILVRAAGNMSGYWGQREATRAAIDAEGWLRTGDAGFLDEDGYLFIHDRVKDMIISGGENVYPAEVENALFGHPAVAEVAVVGVPDPRWGEAVKAIVVRSEGADPSPEEIIAWCRSRIAGFKTPKSVDFVDALPRNASGKLLRRELREPFWAGHARRVS